MTTEFMTLEEQQRFTAYLAIAGAALQMAGDFDKAQELVDVVTSPEGLLEGLTPDQQENAHSWGELIKAGRAFHEAWITFVQEDSETDAKLRERLHAALVTASLIKP